MLYEAMDALLSIEETNDDEESRLWTGMEVIAEQLKVRA